MSPMIRNRVSLIVLAVSLLAAGIAYRLVALQVVQNDRLRQRADVQHVQRNEVAARRGAILDREGRVLALSVPTHSLYVFPNRVVDPKETASRLGRILGLSRSSVLQRITVDRTRYRVRRKRLQNRLAQFLDAETRQRPAGAGQLPRRTT